jgi:two-component system, OmpR family, copper resistance phosphate regulon response regulator CusR
MLTAQDIVTELDAASDDYLTKPFTFADLRLEPVYQKVWCSGNEIELADKEFGLLEYLVRNPNKPLSRAMIADNVWDYGFDRFTNIIDVYVNCLRKKVDKDYPVKLIHTVRGQGYMLRDG